MLRVQHGVFHEAQTRALGLRRDSRGNYPGVRVLPCVWSLLPLPLPEPARLVAALLYTGKTGRLTGLAAASHLGWRSLRGEEPIDTVIPHSKRLTSQSFVRISRTRIEGSVQRLGLAVASPEFVLFACARVLPARELTAVTAIALQRREVLLPALTRTIERYPRVPGTRSVGRSLLALSGGAESIKEVETLAAIAQLGFPPPRCQIWIFDLAGRLICICDFYWEGVAGFYDGGTHLAAEAQEADGLKRTKLETLGLAVVVVTKTLLVERDLLKRRLSAARNTARVLELAREGPAHYVALSDSEARRQAPLSGKQGPLQ